MLKTGNENELKIQLQCVGEGVMLPSLSFKVLATAAYINQDAAPPVDQE